MWDPLLAKAEEDAGPDPSSQELRAMFSLPSAGAPPPAEAGAPPPAEAGAPPPAEAGAPPPAEAGAPPPQVLSLVYDPNLPMIVSNEELEDIALELAKLSISDYFWVKRRTETILRAIYAIKNTDKQTQTEEQQTQTVEAPKTLSFYEKEKAFIIEQARTGVSFLTAIKKLTDFRDRQIPKIKGKTSNPLDKYKIWKQAGGLEYALMEEQLQQER